MTEASQPATDTEQYKRSNRELAAEWAIDVTQDPYSIPLEKIDPGHPGLFEANAVLPYFERLRAEDPVHMCEDSQFGPYWSVTKYDDIMHVDSHEKLFSSDSKYGGIQLGGQPMPEPDPMFSYPCSCWDTRPSTARLRRW